MEVLAAVAVGAEVVTRELLAGFSLVADVVNLSRAHFCLSVREGTLVSLLRRPNDMRR